MTVAVATGVVDGYEARARFARAETDMVPSPRLLRGLLRTAEQVAEVPCGAGHFLADYAATGVETTLIDGNGAMLAAAIEHAAAVELLADRIHAHVGYLQQLGQLVDVDLVVMPNAALNQLASQTPPVELLTVICRALSPGVELLGQVACTHPGGGVDTAGCYDPSRAGGAVLRRRRQHHEVDGAQVRVEFDYVDPAGVSLHATAVELRVFSADELAAIFTTAGFSHMRFLPGHGGLSEVLAQAGGCDLR
ncbi:MAG: methyltransferase domain-containing protein [Pseudonocardiaceae bacterium]